MNKITTFSERPENSVFFIPTENVVLMISQAFLSPKLSVAIYQLYRRLQQGL